VVKPGLRFELIKAIILLGLLGGAIFVLNPTAWEAEGSIPTGVRGPESPDYGRWLYTTNCVGCHGYDGKGKGWLAWTMFVKAPPPDFTNAKRMAAKTDEEFYRSIAEGMRRGHQRTMRGFSSSLSAEDIRLTVAYVRSFSDPLRAPPGTREP
jgi:mono/diheme cytochrome c family protein